MTHELLGRLREPETFAEKQIEVGRLIATIAEHSQGAQSVSHRWYADWYDAASHQYIGLVHNVSHALLGITTSIEEADDEQYRIDLDGADVAVRWYDGTRYLDVTRQELSPVAHQHFDEVIGVLSAGTGSSSDHLQSSFSELAYTCLLPAREDVAGSIEQIAAADEAYRDARIKKLVERIVRGGKPWRSRQTSIQAARRYLDRDAVRAQVNAWVEEHPLARAIPHDRLDGGYRQEGFQLLDDD